MKKNILVTILLSSYMIYACSDDSGSSNDPFDDNVSFTVSGHTEGSYAGYGEVVVFSSSGFTSWGLDSYDIPDDTYFLSIEAFDGMDVINGTGTYSIGGVDEADFFAFFSQTNSDIFYESVSGTFTLTTLNANRAAGTFQFDASGWDSESQDNVTINIRNGEFDVRIYEGEQ